eukprot:777828-Pyramimonas_sp.AAC.1
MKGRLAWGMRSPWRRDGVGMGWHQKLAHYQNKKHHNFYTLVHRTDPLTHPITPPFIGIKLMRSSMGSTETY